MKYLNRTTLFILPAICSFVHPGLEVSAQEIDLKILDNWVEWSNGENMLQLYLNQQAYSLLDRREKEVASLKTREDWEKRQQHIKKVLGDMVGSFPGKTPLNAKITGVIEKEGFRVEKIIYESVPGYYVTACLFIPEGGQAKTPAILNVIGHSTQSFRRDVYQNLILNLVKKDFIVFAIDPVGQGERLQYYDPELKESVVGGSTSEHSYMANQCLLAGYSVAKYFIWDGIRGIDYLLSRKEVDPDRIGLAGLSGGGTQTAYIGAFDERVAAEAPACYITSYRRLLESIGPQDGEQNFYHGLVKGIDHADLLEVHAPKPGLIVSTSRDFFSIQGTVETYEEVKRVYHAFGHEENIAMSTADHVHGHTRKNNEAVYAFFQEMLNNPGNAGEEEVEIFPENELDVTPTGQLSTSFKGKTVFDLNKIEVDKLVRQLEDSRENNPGHLETVIQKAKELSGYIEPHKGSRAVFRGRYRKDGYAVEMYALEGDSGYVIPLLLFIPDGTGDRPCIIYIHPNAKEEGIAPGGNIEKLVKQGFMVAVPDLLGSGETRSQSPYPGSHGYEAQLIGRSIVGIQAGDIVRVVDFLEGLHKVQPGQFQAVAFGEECPALLHAAAFDTSISGIALVDAQISYSCIAQTRLYKCSLSFDWGVAGALMAYDLPDLAACIAPRKLMFMGLLDGAKDPVTDQLVVDQLAFTKAEFAKSLTDHFLIIPKSGCDEISVLSKWLNTK